MGCLMRIWVILLHSFMFQFIIVPIYATNSTLVTGWVPTLLRAGHGMSRWEGADMVNPAKKLVLFSYENNQFARIVREALCKLEPPYILHNVGAGTANYSKLHKFLGFQEVNVPLLIDPNPGVSLSNHDNIIQYLFEN